MPLLEAKSRETAGWRWRPVAGQTSRLSLHSFVFLLSPWSSYFISLHFPLWFSLLLAIMERKWSCWSKEHNGERGAPVGACSVLLFTAGEEERRGDDDSNLEEESRCCEELLDVAWGWTETYLLLTMGTSVGCYSWSKTGHWTLLLHYLKKRLLLFAHCLSVMNTWEFCRNRLIDWLD